MKTHFVACVALTGSVSAAAFGSLPSRATKCTEDNCLRALLRKEREAGVASFCSSLLATSVPATATEAVPTYLANCGPSPTQISRLSSACPCFLGQFTTATSLTSSTTSSASSSSSSTSISSGCPVPTTVTITLPQTSTTCAASTVTETAPGSTVTQTAPGSTVTQTAPVSTVTETSPVSIVTVTSPGTTVTTPGPTTTVTTPGPTTTVTPARRCAEPVADPGFESFTPGLYPWAFAGGGSGSSTWGVDQSKLGRPNSYWPPFSNFKPASGEVAIYLSIGQNPPGTFFRFWQPFAICPGPIVYRPRLSWATNLLLDETVTFRIVLYATDVSNPTAAPKVVYTSTRTVSTRARDWQRIEDFDTWTSNNGFLNIVMHIDVTTSRPNYTLWLDDITLEA